MNATWTLVEASSLALEAPYTFYLPSKQVLAQLQIGDLVKLIFSCDVENEKAWSAERMWVKITSIHGDDFQGELSNSPNYIPDLYLGKAVDSSSYHIIQTQLDDPVPNPTERYWARCFVIRSVLDEKRLVGYLYHEDVDEKGRERNFSGWTLAACDESEAYLDDDENWQYVVLGAVLNIDDRLIDLLESKFVGEFEWMWSEQDKRYTKIGRSEEE
jgi:hypothetical protein